MLFRSVVRENGKYYDIVTQNGCASDSSNNISIDNVGVRPYLSEDRFKFYPNPTKGQIIVEYPKNEFPNGSICIESVNGNLILEKKLIRGSSKIILDLKQFPKGIYIIKVKNKFETFAKKLFKL